MSPLSSSPTTTSSHPDSSYGMEPGRIWFVLPALPPSVNSLYDVLWSQRRVELKKRARDWKTEAKSRMPPWEHTAGAEVRVDVHFEFSRTHRNGTYKVKDVSNMLKLLIDAVAERYGFNDCLVTAGSWSSADAPAERVTVTVVEVRQ